MYIKALAKVGVGWVVGEGGARWPILHPYIVHGAVKITQ